MVSYSLQKCVKITAKTVISARKIGTKLVQEIMLLKAINSVMLQPKMVLFLVEKKIQSAVLL